MRERRLFDIPRRIIAYKTAEAWDKTPHVSIQADLDVTNLLEFIAELKVHPGYRDVHVTVNSVLLKIIAESVKRSAVMNAHIAYDRATGVGELFFFEDVNIAIPMLSKDRHMFTPVLEKVDKKPLREVCLDTDSLKRRAANTDINCLLYETAVADTRDRLKRGHLSVLRRVFANFIGRTKVRFPSRRENAAYQNTPPSERITPGNLHSATILVSNIGSVLPDVPVRIGMLEIIAPQTTVIGLAAIKKQPVVVADDFGGYRVDIRDVLPAAVCFDHRAMDFDHITEFLRAMTELCANPHRLMPETAWEATALSA